MPKPMVDIVDFIFSGINNRLFGKLIGSFCSFPVLGFREPGLDLFTWIKCFVVKAITTNVIWFTKTYVAAPIISVMFSNIATDNMSYSTITKALGNPISEVALSTKPLNHTNLSKPSSIL